MEEYGIFLSFNSQEEVFRLPVNPETLEIKESGDSKSYSIINFGEINAISAPKLTELTLESIFPAQMYPFVLTNDFENGKLKTPFEYVQIIKRWMESRKPIRLVISGVSSPAYNKTNEQDWIKESRADRMNKTDKFKTLFDIVTINMPASIESFSWKLSAGNSGDIDYSLSLKKYEFYQAVPVKVDKGEVKADKKRATDKTSPATYKLKKGDTLWSVAKKVLGDGSKYKVIQKLNGITDSQLTKLPVGKVIKLPQGE
ncbi:LysM peptidoglycan-binding domain-containing protein [Paenibacillus wynnii]|uniref:LysM peptidoglycan-binding domain-containing protein n=1 Tax=Paenibacillus wynnii TaxID=268407 RepID=UPI00278FA40C|nr:LysM peptidoglycan-binding domain-containing protein [Paenibacillus wynnii]MDQ0195801.1 LysM repeat protein [Paenibacillus wynnii]